MSNARRTYKKEKQTQATARQAREKVSNEQTPREAPLAVQRRTPVPPRQGGVRHRRPVSTTASLQRLAKRRGLTHQAKPAPIGREGGTVDSATADAIQQERGGGQSLPGDVRNPMERAFGADFGGVRVHSGSRSDQLNRAVSARAFTTGSDIFFRQGAYEPHSRSGQELLAHELTHVVQQGSAARGRAARGRAGTVARRKTVQRQGKKGKKKGNKGSNSTSAGFKLQDLTFKGFSRFLRMLLGLKDPTAVASLSTNITFYVGVAGGVGDVLNASVGPYIKLDSSMQVLDDRSLKVSGSLEFGAKSKLDIAKLWSTYAQVGMKVGIAGAFEDEKHLAAYIISRIAALLKGFKRLVVGHAKKKKKQLTRQQLKAINQIGLPSKLEEGYEELSKKGMSSTTLSVGGTAEVGTDVGSAVTAKVTASATEHVTFKKNAKGRRVRKVGNTRVASFSLGLAVPLPHAKLGITVDVTRTIISTGSDTLKITVTPAIPIGKQILTQALIHLPGNLEGEGFKKSMIRFLKGMFSPVNLASMAGIRPGESPVIELSFISRIPPKTNKMFFKQLKDGDYALQYGRILKSMSTKAEQTGQVPTGVPGLQVDLAGSVSFTRNVGAREFLGTRTLAYIQTVYGGLLNRGRRGQNQWEQYREAHKKEIYEMFVAVADPSSTAAQQVADLDTSPVAGQLNRVTLLRAHGFKRACETRFDKKQLANYDRKKPSDRKALENMGDQVMPYFDAYLAAAHAVSQYKDARTWRAFRSGTVKAQVTDKRRPLKPQLTKVKFDKGVKDDHDPAFPRTLRESLEEGFHNHVAFTGVYVPTGKDKTINLKYRRPDDPAEKLVKKVKSSRIRRFISFPMGLTLLDNDFRKHARKSELKYKLLYNMRLQQGKKDKKARKEADQERQKFWESKLYTHLEQLMEKTLDTKPDRSAV